MNQKDSTAATGKCRTAKMNLYKNKASFQHSNFKMPFEIRVLFLTSFYKPVSFWKQPKNQTKICMLLWQCTKNIFKKFSRQCVSEISILSSLKSWLSTNMSIVNTTYLNNKSIKTCLTGWKLLWTNRCNKALFPVLLSPTTTMVHLVSLAILVMIRLVCFFHIKTIILFTILVFFHVSKLVSKLEKKSVNVPHRRTVLQRLTVQQYVECGSVPCHYSAPLPYRARAALCTVSQHHCHWAEWRDYLLFLA